MINKTYCERAFNNIYSNSKGQYKLCCYASTHPLLKKFTVNTHKPFEFFLSNEMEEIRNMMLSNQYIEGCEYCYTLEKNEFKSPRLESEFKKINLLDIEPNSVGLEVRLFGSSCNLSCYMCYPYNSSLKYKELKKIDTTIFEDSFYIDNSFFNSFKHVSLVSIENVLEHIDLINYIQIIGGEPFISSEHWKFLDAISNEFKKKIELRYQTNLTVLQYKYWSFNDYIDKFKKIKLYVSADHYKEKLSWIRYPIDIQKFENNLRIYSKYIEEIHFTLSVLNACDIVDIVSYYQEVFNIRVKLNTLVQTPYALSVKNLPNFKKETIKQKFDLLKNVPDAYYAELQKPRVEEEYSKFVSYIKELDRKRGTNANKIFGWKIYD